MILKCNLNYSKSTIYSRRIIIDINMIHILRRFIITVLFILLSQILSCAGNKLQIPIFSLQIPIFSWSVRVFCSGLDIAMGILFWFGYSHFSHSSTAAHRCLRRLSFRVKALLQTWHGNGFSPVCETRCLFKPDFDANDFSQMAQWGRFSSVCT